jgi:hypothetical protein
VLVRRSNSEERGTVLRIVLPATQDATDWSLPSGGVLIEGGGMGLCVTAHLEEDEDVTFVKRGTVASPASD